MKRFRFAILSTSLVLLGGVPALAREPPAPTPTPPPAPTPVPAGAPPQQASSILNPNVSLVGNLIAFGGNDRTLPEKAFEFSEAELAIQAPIDPYARADVFIAITPEGAEIEEAYATWLTLPGSWTLKTGKFRSNFGKFNRIHPPETPFADRPLATEVFFGEEGLAAIGLSASYLAPLPFYLNFDAEVTTNWRDAPLFGEEDDEGEIRAGGRRDDLGYLLRASTYHDFTESVNTSLGLNFARGVHDEEGDFASEVFGGDVTFRWKDPRRAIYRSFLWQTELYLARREEDSGSGNALGGFSYAEYQFARRWRVGLRADYAESLLEEDKEEGGGLLYLTFRPSEFSAISLQGRAIRRAAGREDLAAFLKLRFNIGPHGVEPF